MENQNDDELKFENELLKLKLIAESGAHFSESNNTPPQVENIWLNHIMAYEEASKDRKMIKVFDKIQRPQFSLTIDEDKLPSELDRLLEHLFQHHIKVTSICEVSDREFYRFIIEDLFEEEILDINHNLGYTCFTYEDFYPNHPHDIENRIDDFFQVLTKEEVGLYSWVFSSEFNSVNGTTLTEAEVMLALNNFFNEHTAIKILPLDNKELKITDNKAVMDVFVRIEAFNKSMNSIVTYEGEGRIALELDFEWWSITGIDLPGLKI